MPFILPNQLSNSAPDELRKSLLRCYIYGTMTLDQLQEKLEDVAIGEHNELMNSQS